MSGKLKPGWKIVQFGDVVKNVKISVDRNNNPFERYVAGEHMNTEDIHIREWGTFGSDYVGPAFHRQFLKGQVLYGSRRTYLKKVAFAEFDGVTANTTFVLETRDSKALLQELLPFIMLSDNFTEHSIRESKGSTNPYINWPDIAKYEFPLPPLDEQRQIAEILWTADEAEEHIIRSKDVINNLKRIYTSNIITNCNNVKWPMTKLTDCFEIVSGQVDPKKERYKNLPLVAPNHIEQKTGKVINIETAFEQNAISGKYLFRPGDVIYSKIRPNLQKAFISDFEGLCSADMYPLRPFLQKINPRYLLAILLSDKFTYFATSRSVRTGFPKINRQELSEFKIPLPPISVQNKICIKLEHIDKQEEILLLNRMNILELKNSLINHAMEKNNV